VGASKRQKDIGKGEEDEYDGCIFVFMQENRITNPVEIFLRGLGLRKNDGIGESN
jgi:hypothetical protein